MNICFVNPTRSLQSGLKGLTKSLATFGHKVIILTSETPGEDELGALSPVKVITYPSLFIPKIRYTLPFFFRQLRIVKDVVSREKIDVIYIYKYAYITGLVPLLYAKINHLPVIVITDAFAGISWRYGSRFVDITAKVYSHTIGRLILGLSDRVIIFSPALLESARSVGAREPKLLVVPKGIEFTQPEADYNPDKLRQALGIKRDEIMILNVGRLVPVKGIDILIKITEGLVKDGRSVRAVIVGDGPYRHEYEEKAKSLGDKIIFTGFRRDIPELLAACDVFVLPSISEGTPSAVLEAAACGKPVVASDTGGISDIIIHGKTGFLVEPGDVDSFVHYIRLLVNDRDLASRLGKNVYQHIKSNFDWSVITRRHEEICREVIESKRLSKGKLRKKTI